MQKNPWFCGIALGAVIGMTSLYAQEPERPVANGDILNMLQAGVPESTILSQIEILAGQGSTFDISPRAMIEMNRRGASETVLNRMIWAQTEVVPAVWVPVPRGVFYRSGANATPLSSFMVWAEFAPRWGTWPLWVPGPKDVALPASPAVVQVADGTPTLLVQGFSSDAGWQLVRIQRGPDYREMKLKTKHGFGKDFFSDSVFERSDLRPVSFAPQGPNSFSVRPASALEAGAYALCTRINDTWMRACYEFQVAGSVQ